MAPPLRPEGMSAEAWQRLRGLPDTPTARHPFGLRNAVMERAAILHFEGGMSWADADERAYVLEVGGQRSMFGGGR